MPPASGSGQAAASIGIFPRRGPKPLVFPHFHYLKPKPFFTGRPFAMTHAPAVAELPAIGAVLISHGYCDHLDYRAIQEIDSGAKRFFVPLGVKAHLQRWGVRRNTTLWGGYAIKPPGMPLYFSADSGFGKHFSGIISKYAPFDFVMIENGACPGKVAGKRAVACAAHAPRRERMSKRRENQKTEISQCPDAEWKICYQCGSEYDFYGPKSSATHAARKALTA